jgi:rhodanese-related sulfurtransferase
LFSVFKLRCCLLLLCCLVTLNACTDHAGVSQKQFYTWDGLEPDRWSSVWLIKRHVDPTAQISIVPVGARMQGAEAIATIDSSIKRSHGKSNYENLLAAYKKAQDPVLTKIGDIINELEISPWSGSSPLTTVVEDQFRNLQYKYNRVDVPIACYSGFFDALYNVLENSAEDLAAVTNALQADTICRSLKEAVASKSNVPVLEYSTKHVLDLIHANKKVVFVDTREDDEFDERHIPGAINIKLRDVDDSVSAQFADADLVIAYCIKDFRGYEVALALSKVGVKNTGIMNPFGLKGWMDTGLPVTDAKTSDAVALEQLKLRAAQGV